MNMLIIFCILHYIAHAEMSTGWVCGLVLVMGIDSFGLYHAYKERKLALKPKTDEEKIQEIVAYEKAQEGMNKIFEEANRRVKEAK